MNKNSNSSIEIEEAKNIYIGRLFTLGGSVLFLIGSLIAAIVGYQAYMRLLNG
ncbi:hypothetical protein MKX67_18845 [Cytobacillus sp. FSL W7-1323]|uniref:hypothetical protein n=1 Tax=Cytobacillus TaxID=2675230 RepID=UPI0015D5A00A|nr:MULTISPECIES: hypothetical protein [Cytobacillus]MEA1855268.1 hypothetical protein [Cytobacillus sp. OWB-43]MED1604036.1 hypothetical protein [Cytobacillus kochii]